MCLNWKSPRSSALGEAETEEPMNTVIPFNQSLRDCLREAHSRIRTATQSVAKTQKAHFDKRVKDLQFTQGQLVWLFWPNPPRRQKFKKLLWLWTGPWRIDHFVTDVVVNLRHTQTQQRQTVHVNRLSPCVSSEPNSVLDSSSEEPLATYPKFPLRLNTSPAPFWTLLFHRILR